MPLPKPVKVNGTAVTEEYLIQNGDEIQVSTTYKYDEFFEYMGISPEDMILFINGARADDTMEICASDQLEFKNRKEYELKEIYKESHIERRETKKEEKEKDKEKEKRREKHKPDNGKSMEKTDETEPAEEAVTATEPESGIEEPQTEAEDSTEETGSGTEDSETVSAEAEPASESEAKVKTEVEIETVQESPEPETAQEAEPEPETEIRREQPEPATQTEEVHKEPEAAPEPERKAAESRDTERYRKERTYGAVKRENREERKAAAKEKEEPPVDIGKKIIVIVNQKPIVMRGKQSYMFVDIFDYIDFDTRKMQGSGIATLVNGKDAQYTQELFNGDKIEVYWK